MTPGRHGKYDGHRKTQPTNDIEKLECLPEREGMMKRWPSGRWGWSFGDHINPLRKWLKKQVGRPFDKVYSEFCKHADSRSLRGWHARDHFWMEVDTYEERLAALEQRWKHPSNFYVDPQGILREDKDYRRWPRRKPQYDPDKCKIGDRDFERINDCWFEVWFTKEEKAAKRWNYLLNRHDVEYSYIDVKVNQKQLSKKELKDLGLRNGPDLNWWEY